MKLEDASKSIDFGYVNRELVFNLFIQEDSGVTSCVLSVLIA